MCDLATRGTVACDTLILEDVPARIEQEGTTGATQTTNPPPNNAALASQLPAITARETCFFFCFLFFVFFIFPFFSCSIAPPFRSKKRSTVETPLEIRPHEIKQEHPTINESTFMNFILFYRINSYFSRQEQKVRNLIGPFKTKQTPQQFPTKKKRRALYHSWENGTVGRSNQIDGLNYFNDRTKAAKGAPKTKGKQTKLIFSGCKAGRALRSPQRNDRGGVHCAGAPCPSNKSLQRNRVAIDQEKKKQIKKPTLRGARIEALSLSLSLSRKSTADQVKGLRLNPTKSRRRRKKKNILQKISRNGKMKKKTPTHVHLPAILFEEKKKDDEKSSGDFPFCSKLKQVIAKMGL